MTTTLRCLAFVALLTTPALAACGGDDEPSSSGTADAAPGGPADAAAIDVCELYPRELAEPVLGATAGEPERFTPMSCTWATTEPYRATSLTFMKGGTSAAIFTEGCGKAGMAMIDDLDVLACASFDPDGDGGMDMVMVDDETTISVWGSHASRDQILDVTRAIIARL